MPTFTTPTAIDVSMKVPAGAVTVIASDRKDTVVTVKPTNPNRAADVRGAAETSVDFKDNLLTIKGPRHLNWMGPTESVDVTVEVPSGSRFTADVSAGGVRTRGPLGATRIKLSAGTAEVDHTGDLWLKVSHGSASVVKANGTAEITADHGQIRLGEVTADAMLKASHGSITVGTAGGDLEAKLSYGDLELATAHGSVTAKTAFGTIGIGEVSSGSMNLESAFGAINVGVRPGVPAWLDVSTKRGHVRSELDGDSAPASGEESVVLRARTEFGDITVRRAA